MIRPCSPNSPDRPSQAENASSILVARSTYSGKKVQVERLLFTGCDSSHANCGCHLVPFANGVGG